MIDATGMLDAVLSAYFVLIEVAARRRDLERAHALLEQLETLGHARKWGRIVAAALATRLRLHLAEGRITEAGACLNRLERLAADYPAPTRCAWSEIHDQALLAWELMETAQKPAGRGNCHVARLAAQAATNELSRCASPVTWWSRCSPQMRRARRTRFSPRSSPWPRRPIST